VSKGCQYFIELCRELFQLEEKYGYSSDDEAHDVPECSVKLRKGDREVLLLIDYIEHYGQPTIMLRPPDPNERFGLHEALPAMSVEFPDFGMRMSAEQLRELLEHYAAFFHEHSHGLLEDHSEIFAAVKKRREG
jgi:hypothetical protein